MNTTCKTPTDNLRARWPSYPSPNLALTGDPRRQSLATAGTNGRYFECGACVSPVVVSDAPVKRKPPLSRRDNDGQQKRVMRFELTTFTLATCGQWVLNSADTRVTALSNLPSTTPCTSPSMDSKRLRKPYRTPYVAFPQMNVFVWRECSCHPRLITRVHDTQLHTLSGGTDKTDKRPRECWRWRHSCSAPGDSLVPPWPMNRRDTSGNSRRLDLTLFSVSEFLAWRDWGRRERPGAVSRNQAPPGRVRRDTAYPWP